MGSFDDLKTIAKWLDEDSVKKPRGSLFNMEDVKQRLVSRYK